MAKIHITQDELGKIFPTLTQLIEAWGWCPKTKWGLCRKNNLLMFREATDGWVLLATLDDFLQMAEMEMEEFSLDRIFVFYAIDCENQEVDTHLIAFPSETSYIECVPIIGTRPMADVH